MTVSEAKAQNAASHTTLLSLPGQPGEVRFNRQELSVILRIYGRFVASGEWRDYAIAFSSEKAVFAILRHTGEMPLYRIEKDPKRASKQGAYAVIAQGGLVIKRGRELEHVLAVFD